MLQESFGLLESLLQSLIDKLWLKMWDTVKCLCTFLLCIYQGFLFDTLQSRAEYLADKLNGADNRTIR